MNLPADQISWVNLEILQVMEKCKANRIHPTAFLFALQQAAENAYMDKLDSITQEEWDWVVQEAKDEVHIAKKVSKDEISIEDAMEQVRKMRAR